MNLSLVDPFILTQDYPETPVASLRAGHVCYVRFNKQGDLLAAGSVSGKITVLDCETYGVARKLRGHRRQIYSLSWSQDGRYLLSASQDCKVLLWDLFDGTVLRDVRLESPCYATELHPANHLVFAAAVLDRAPLLVDCTDPIPDKFDLPTTQRQLGTDGGTPDPMDKHAYTKHVVTSVVFTSTGEHLIAGTAKGSVNIIDLRTKSLLYSTKVAGGFITHIRLSNGGKDLLLNAGDRIIRTIPLPNLAGADLDPDTIDLAPEHKFADLVNRLSWNHVAFSATGEYVTASTYNNHDIYIWERGHGSLVKILEGPKEEHGAVEWHPTKPLIAACGLETGRIHLWGNVPQQRWSALAPDFVEVEENVEYMEKEDEFDIYDAEELHKRRLDKEDEFVDVLGPGDDDESHTASPRRFQIPVQLDCYDSEPEDEFVHVKRGEVRRKSPGAGQEFLDQDAALSTAPDEGRKTKVRVR